MTKCRITGERIGFNPEHEFCLCKLDRDCCLRVERPLFTGIDKGDQPFQGSNFNPRGWGRR